MTESVFGIFRPRSYFTALEKELETYTAKLQELTASRGKFVLIQGDDIINIFDTYADAIKVGYANFGLKPFLVKQIQTIEQSFVLIR